MDRHCSPQLTTLHHATYQVNDMNTCSTCRFFDQLESGPNAENVIEPMGFCRISPPRTGKGTEVTSQFPKVWSTDWCGAHSVGDEATALDDLGDLLDNPGEGVPAHDNPSRPLEPLDVVIMDNLHGTRGVAGIIQKVEGDTVHVMIAGTVYPIARELITERTGRTAGARA